MMGAPSEAAVQQEKKAKTGESRVFVYAQMTLTVNSQKR